MTAVDQSVAVSQSASQADTYILLGVVPTTCRHVLHGNIEAINDISVCLWCELIQGGVVVLGLSHAADGGRRVGREEMCWRSMDGKRCCCLRKEVEVAKS